MRKESLLMQAFLDPLNVAVMIFALITSEIMRSSAPLMLGMIWEIGYLSIVPQSEWYRRRLALRQEAMDETRRVEERPGLRMQLSSEDSKRYERLQRLCREIRATTEKAQDDAGGIVTTDLSGLDALAHSFLQLLATKRRYSERTSEYQSEKLAQEIAEAEQRLQAETEPEVRRILEQNRDLLRKRQTMGERVSTNLRMLDAQVDAIENAVELLADTVISMKASPGAIAGELENVVSEVEVTERILRETAPALEEFQRMMNRGRAAGF